MSLLEGKVMIVSGVGPGYGVQIARAAAREGAAVVLGARSADYLDAVATELAGEGFRALPVRCDVTRDGDCAAIVEAALERFGRVDSLVNNAFASGPRDVPIERSDFDAWQVAFDVNVFGTLRLCKAAIPALKATEGSIVMVNSQITRRVFPGRGPYASSKGALLVAAKVLAKELGPDNVRVNTVVPGRMVGPTLLDSYALRAERKGITLDEEMAQAAATLTLPKLPTDEECAGTVLFLASDLALAMTGQSIDVNGGETFH